MKRPYFLTPICLLFVVSAVVAQPVVNLGPNVSACDVQTLNAGNPGATFLWNTGATTGNINVTTTGTYWVNVTAGGLTGSDTIEVTIVPSPIIPVAQMDTMICGAGNHLLSPAHYTDTYRWYTTAVGGTPFHFNNTLIANISGNSTYFLEGANTGFMGSIGETGIGVNNYNASPRGTYFDVFETMVINGVYMIAQNNPSFNIELRNAANVILQSTSVTLGPGVTTFVPLDFTVQPGVGYNLRVTGITGGTLGRISTGITYPYTIPGKISLTGVYNSPVTSFNYLFDWSISTPYCVAPRIPFNVSVGMAPVVELGSDTLLCGGTLFLDATNNLPNVNYIWSTGETTPSIVVANTQYINVLISTGLCFAEDSINVQVAQNAFAPLVPTHLSLCSGDTAEVASFGSNGAVLWYDAVLGGNILGYGDTLRALFPDSVVVFAESVTNGTIYPTGAEDNTFAGGTFATLNNRGGVFDVIQSCILYSVTVFAQSNPTFTVELKDNTNAVIYSKIFTVASGLNRLTLEWPISPGTGYKLVGRAISGGQLYLNTSGAAYPYSCPLLSITNSTTLATYYEYFYDWRVGNIDVCVSARNACALNIIPNPVAGNLPDSSLCGVLTFDLNAGNTGASFVWNTGATTQEITVSQNGEYIVTITNGGTCTRLDTADLRFFALPPAPLAQALNICQPGEVALLPSNQFLLWYDTPLGDTSFYAGSPLNANVQNDTTFYVEAAARDFAETGVSGHANPAGGNFFAFPIGMIFDAPVAISLDSVAVYLSNAPASFTVLLRDQTGTVLASRAVTVTQAGQKTFIPLDFAVPTGSGYRLQFSNLVGGGLASSPAVFPMDDGRISITGNSIGTAENFYFYDWHYSFGLGSCRSQRVPVSIDVRLPLNLPDTLYSCNGFALDATLVGANYLWGNGETTSSISITNPGTYSITLTEQGGTCTATDAVGIGFPPAVGLPIDGIICDSILQTNFSPPAQFIWNTGATTGNISIQNPGLYAVTITDAGGCILSDSIDVIEIGIPPTILLPSAITDCQTTVLDAGNNGTAYIWNTGETTNVVTVGTPGNYGVTVTNADGCVATAAVEVALEQPPVADFIYDIVGNGLRYEFDNQSSPGSYLWDFGFITSTASDPIVLFPEPGNYMVTLIVTNSCGSDTMTIDFLADFIGVHPLSNENGIKIFPNPVSDDLFLDFRLLDIIPLKVAIFDAQGRLQINFHIIENEHFVKIDLKNLPTGVYGVLLEWGDGSRVCEKVIKI